VDAMLITVAFLLGFLERLFTSLVTRASERIDEEIKKGPAPALPPSALTGAVTGAAATAARPGAAAGAQAPARTLSVTDRILRELDVQAGERAAFIGDPASPARGVLAATLGADHVFDVTTATIAAKAPLDAVLFETPPSVGELTIAAGQIGTALRPDGRVVVLGSTPAALFDADAATQRAQNHVGPALMKDILTSVGGLSSQEPPDSLGGTDPIAWLAAFVKPAAGGSDR